MDYRSSSRNLHCLVAAMIAASLPAVAHAASDVDAGAAIRLARQDHCLRCHGVDKKKEGPSYAFLAARYEGKPGAEEKLIKHITSGELVKLSDGHKENHKVIQNANPAELRNLVRWILSQGD
ncbi:MAG: c-type cytochrome [Rhodocyclaceae bacterium]|nr:c-type cytochrome [Rhodocyclaceae bacterium]